MRHGQPSRAEADIAITSEERIQPGVDLPGQMSMNNLVSQWQVFPARLAGLGETSPDRRAPS